jgi:autotransporter-associated beta strand protein
MGGRHPAYADNTNTDGILGGWALLNEGAFAAMNTSTRAVGQVGTAQRWDTDSWGNNLHVVVMGGGVRTAGDVSPNSVRYQAGQPAFTNDFADAVLTIKSGGLAVNNTAPCKLENGVLRSGFETGELFVFTAGLFEISSKIEDNGDTPFTLVKAQSGTLVLSGELAFTGDIYLNGGKLVLTGDGAEIESEIHQSGGTTLALSNGANLKCNGDGRVLGGNLELGSGSKLNMEICGKTSGGDLIVPLTLPNRFGTFNVTADMENPVELILDVAPGADIKRGNYPLVRWTDATTVSGLDVDLFVFDVHNTIQGEIVAVENGIDFVVTSVARGALITVR